MTDAEASLLMHRWLDEAMHRPVHHWTYKGKWPFPRTIAHQNRVEGERKKVRSKR